MLRWLPCLLCGNLRGHLVKLAEAPYAESYTGDSPGAGRRAAYLGGFENFCARCNLGRHTNLCRCDMALWACDVVVRGWPLVFVCCEESIRA
jgi:hypothetical protein